MDARVLPTDRLAAHQFPICVTLPDRSSVERPTELPKEVKEMTNDRWNFSTPLPTLAP